MCHDTVIRNIEYTMIHENMLSWKELITLKLCQNYKICIWIVII